MKCDSNRTSKDTVSVGNGGVSKKSAGTGAGVEGGGETEAGVRSRTVLFMYF